MVHLNGKVFVLDTGLIKSDSIDFNVPIKNHRDALLECIKKTLNCELHGEVKVTVECTKDDVSEKKALDTDEDIDRLSMEYFDELVFEVSVTPKAVMNVFKVESMRKGDFLVPPVESVLEIDICGGDLVTVLQEHIQAVHELESTKGLILCIKIGDDYIMLSNSTVAREILFCNVLETDKLCLVFDKEVESEMLKTNIIVSTESKDMIQFEFTFRVDQTTILDSLKTACLAELEQEGPVELAVSIDDVLMVMSSDRMTCELLTEYANEGKAVHLSLDGPGVTKVNAVRATHMKDQEVMDANFDFKYRSSQLNLLESLKQECRGEFEISPESPLDVVVLVQGKEVPLVDDELLLGILLSLIKTRGALEINVTATTLIGSHPKV